MTTKVLDKPKPKKITQRPGGPKKPRPRPLEPFYDFQLDGPLEYGETILIHTDGQRERIPAKGKARNG